MAPASPESFMFTVGKLDAGMAILIGERAHLIEFPSLLLPPGVTSGSIVNIAVHRNVDEEHRQKQEFWDLQEQIVKTYGQDLPEAPKVEVRNVTQTSVTLEWPSLKLATAKLRSLDIYRNGQRLASVPSPLTNTTSRLSGLSLQTQYTFQLILRTTAGTFPSNVIRVTTHSINDTSGISVCFGNVQDSVLLERAKMCLKEMGAKWSDRIQIDTTHFVCSTPAAIPTPGATGSISGPGVEYQRALQASIPVVQPQWIIACYSEKKMVPISGYYLGASPSAPVPTSPFTRPISNAPQVASPPRRDSSQAQSPGVNTALSNQTAGALPSPETLARSSSNEAPEVNADASIAAPAASEEVDGDPVERSQSSPSPGGRPRNGTMKRDYKFPPPPEEKSPVSADGDAPVLPSVSEAPLSSPSASEAPGQQQPVVTAQGEAGPFAETSELPKEAQEIQASQSTPDHITVREAKPSVPELAISPPADDSPSSKSKDSGAQPDEEEEIGDVVDVDLS